MGFKYPPVGGAKMYPVVRPYVKTQIPGDVRGNYATYSRYVEYVLDFEKKRHDCQCERINLRDDASRR